MTLYYFYSLLAVIFTLGLVILLHEFGHFLMCKKFGVRVERFAFGFGPELFGVTHRGTRFSVCAVPMGGFVKPAGESLEETTGKSDEYFAQPWNKRLGIVAAGPIMNYVLAFTLFTGVVYIKGEPEVVKTPVIGNMMTGYPADVSGVKPDDEVVSVNGKAVTTWEELADTIHQHPNEAIELALKRGGEPLTLRMTTRKDDATGNGVIGILPKSSYRPVGFPEAAMEGAKQCYALTKLTVTTIAAKLGRFQKPDLAGPVGIVQMVSRAAHSGWEDLLFLMGLLSVAIGFFNFLPIPLLDGGHGAMYIWEGVSGKKLTPGAVSTANGIGIVFLMSLLLFATYNDVTRIAGDRAARKKAALEQQAPKK